MRGKVLMPIPGTGYSIGETASFPKEGVEKFREYLENAEYFEISGKKADDDEEEEGADGAPPKKKETAAKPKGETATK